MTKELIESFKAFNESLLGLANELLVIVEKQNAINIHFASKIKQLETTVQTGAAYPYSNARKDVIENGLEVGK